MDWKFWRRKNSSTVPTSLTNDTAAATRILPSRLLLLVTEDNPIHLKILLAMLAKHDEHFSIVTATNLTDAMKILDAQRPDAVLLDLGLADSPSRMHTLTVFMPLANKFKIPVVICSKDHTDTMADAALAMGAMEYIWKTPAGGPREADLFDALRKAAHRVGHDRVMAACDKIWEEANKRSR